MSDYVKEMRVSMQQNAKAYKPVHQGYPEHTVVAPLIEFREDNNVKAFNPARYNVIVNDVFALVNKLSKLKGDEYAAGADRLANFRQAAERLDVPMELVWQIYAQKHWDAISQYVKDIKNGVSRERMEPPSSRAVDIIVYLLLLICMMEERDGKPVAL